MVSLCIQMARLLKQALQPSINSVSIDWKIPSAKIVQTPKQLPAIFPGSRLVVFGFPSHSADVTSVDSRLDCEAVLHYQLEREEKSLTVKFSLSPPHQHVYAGDEVDGFGLHRLAGKQILRDLAKEDGDKKELVRVSIETNVVCKETAFVAVDEESTEAVTGALEAQTIAVPTRWHFQAAPLVVRLCGRSSLRYLDSDMSECEGAIGSSPMDSAWDSCLAPSDGPRRSTVLRSAPSVSPAQNARSQRSASSSAGVSASSSQMSRQKHRGVSRTVRAAGSWLSGLLFSSSAKSKSPKNPKEESISAAGKPAQSLQGSHLVVVSLQKASGAWLLN